MHLLKDDPLIEESRNEVQKLETMEEESILRAPRPMNKLRFALKMNVVDVPKISKYELFLRELQLAKSSTAHNMYLQDKVRRVCLNREQNSDGTQLGQGTSVNRRSACRTRFDELAGKSLDRGITKLNDVKKIKKYGDRLQNNYLRVIRRIGKIAQRKKDISIEKGRELVTECLVIDNKFRNIIRSHDSSIHDLHVRSKLNWSTRTAKKSPFIVCSTKKRSPRTNISLFLTRRKN